MEINAGLIALGAGISIFGGAIGTAYAQAAIGAAGMGVLAEKPDLSGKMILFIALPETIVIMALIVAYLMITQMSAVVGA